MSEEQKIYHQHQKLASAGWKLREARLCAAIATQKELAEQTGIAPNIISDLECGRRRITPSWAKKIAQATGKNMNDLLKD